MQSNRTVKIPPAHVPNRLYTILGVDRKATTAEIKKAYHALALVHHPDKGGDEDVFKEISHAYEVLGSEDKRRSYDQVGEESERPEHGSRNNNNSSFRQGWHSFQNADGMSFAFGALFDLLGLHLQAGLSQLQQQWEQERQQRANAVFDLDVTVAELYSCAPKQLRVERAIECPHCHGVGGKPIVCPRCMGAGYQLNRAGARAMCDHCSLRGFVLDPMCFLCRGTRTVKREYNLTLQLRPGQETGELIRIPWETQTRAERAKLDPCLLVRLRELKDPVFQHYGDHLLVDRTVALVDALSGAPFLMTHVDGSRLVVQPKGVLRPCDLYTLPGFGMPRKDGVTRGNLYLRFTVDFPALLPDNTKRMLRSILPGACLLPGGEAMQHLATATLEPNDRQLDLS